MRELKDYFCTYEQTKELMKLGLIGIWHLKHITPKNEIPYQISENCLGAILRSQALDYFRSGYSWGELRCDDFYFVVYINETAKYFFTEKQKTYHEAESALIDKLIELEKEARNGK